MDADPNLTLSGFDVIEDIKAQVEKKCPGVVSCADLLALAARDSVSFQFQKPLWEVLTGRRDGRVSRISEAMAEIPTPFSNFTTLVQSYARKGLTIHDLVVLSGYTTLNRAYAKFLKTKCRSLSETDTTTVEMDPRSSFNFDNNYYHVLKRNMGLLQSDAALITDKESLKIVNEMLNPLKFFQEFALSMQKAGAIGVLTGNAGEIRKKCYVVN
ncbi:Plant peroxidase [Corchorus olitorius]|uniref:peroxidase n=1 Tax=Corchorus olitorius TaxID=93759 RepID=A0A1R3KHT2_9ROSI|nr:Plant peroxidase [Corchorus olitorius]